MSGDISNDVVLQAITNLTAKVEQYHGDFREFRGNTDERVKSLEQSARENRIWTNIKMFCLIPLGGGLHQIASHFGWIK